MAIDGSMIVISEKGENSMATTYIDNLPLQMYVYQFGYTPYAFITVGRYNNIIAMNQIDNSAGQSPCKSVSYTTTLAKETNPKAPPKPPGNALICDIYTLVAVTDGAIDPTILWKEIYTIAVGDKLLAFNDGNVNTFATVTDIKDVTASSLYSMRIEPIVGINRHINIQTYTANDILIHNGIVSW